jgi:copper chaperone
MRAIKVIGMSCQHCVKAVTKTLSDIEGVRDIQVDLAKGEVTFKEEHPVDTEVVRERIKKAGYELV